MLNSSVNYPYPLLRIETEDYKTSTFEGNIQVENQQSGYEITVNYHVNNDEINRMIEDGTFSFALQIECVSTLYRDFRVSFGEQQKFVIPANMVHDRVDLCPCIIARKNVTDFFVSDFSEDYSGIRFNINKGEVIGIGERKKFDAVYKDDIIKKSESIVHFNCDDKATIMRCEFDKDTIQIYLPKKQWEQYSDMGSTEAWKIPMLNAIYVTPVIVQAVMEIHAEEVNEIEGEEGLSHLAWFKTLKLLMLKIAKNDKTKYKKMFDEPITTAQKLLDNNSAQALDILNNVVKNR